MNKRLILILALAFCVGMGFNAYAEVQNVKVGGDLKISSITRNNFNLVKDAAGNKLADRENIFLSQVRLRVDADLTDNVATTIRLINERNWEQENVSSTDIDIDLAYVTLKEFLYSPMTLTIGRQEIRLGNGLIIGNARNWNTGAGSVTLGIPTDLNLRRAFDALRVNLNYDPLVVDAIYAKIRENTGRGTTAAPQNDDRDLFGINASYDITKNTKAEGYLFCQKNSQDSSVPGTDKADKVYTIGALISGKPMDNLKASIESAFQFGHRRATGGQTDYKAWALQPILIYDIKGIQMIEKCAPQIGLSYTYLSGNKVNDDSSFQLWNPMFYDQALNDITYAIIPFSNLQVINLKASMKPTDDVTLLANYGYYRLAKKAATLTAPYFDSNGASYGTYTLRGEKDLGSALDITALYDYTEDVQFGLATGMFFPGQAFNNDENKAVQVIGSMKVTF